MTPADLDKLREKLPLGPGVMKLNSDLAEWPEKNRTGTGAPPRSASTMEQKLNHTEKRWLAVLRAKIQAGHYQYVGIQEINLRLAFDTRYLPDFHAVTYSGHVFFFETKGGFEREDSWIKLKMAAAKFPYWTFIKAVWKNNEWKETVVRP